MNSGRYLPRVVLVAKITTTLLQISNRILEIGTLTSHMTNRMSQILCRAHRIASSQPLELHNNLKKHLHPKPKKSYQLPISTLGTLTTRRLTSISWRTQRLGRTRKPWTLITTRTLSARVIQTSSTTRGRTLRRCGRMQWGTKQTMLMMILMMIGTEVVLNFVSVYFIKIISL